MPILRLAYTAEFLLALVAVFVLWSEVGGQSHLDLMPWYLKLVLGGGAAFSTVKATSAAVSHDRGWNGQTLRWAGILLALLVGCGLASYFSHVYGEQDEDQEDESLTSSLVMTPHDTLVGDARVQPSDADSLLDSRFCLGTRGAPPRRPHCPGPLDAGSRGTRPGHARAG